MKLNFRGLNNDNNEWNVLFNIELIFFFLLEKLIPWYILFGEKRLNKNSWKTFEKFHFWKGIIKHDENSEEFLRLIDMENRKIKKLYKTKLYKSEKEIIDRVYEKEVKEIKIEIGKI